MQRPLLQPSGDIIMTDKGRSDRWIQLVLKNFWSCRILTCRWLAAYRGHDSYSTAAKRRRNYFEGPKGFSLGPSNLARTDSHIQDSHLISWGVTILNKLWHKKEYSSAKKEGRAGIIRSINWLTTAWKTRVRFPSDEYFPSPGPGNHMVSYPTDTVSIFLGKTQYIHLILWG
jgi:hypothetical protein